jgi:uncharacterized protein (DUF1778 family)
MARKSKTAVVQLKLRIREGLRELLAREAEKAGRSLNQEMASRLERSFALEAELEEAKLRIAEQDLAKTLLKLAQETLHRAGELPALSRSKQHLEGLLSPASDEEK